MFPRHNRLTRQEIADLIKTGSVFTTSLFSMKVKKNPENQHKFAFVISKKELKTAPNRNRVKRRFRASLRGMLPSLLPCSAAFFLKRGILDTSHELLLKEIQNVFKKTGFGIH